MGGMGWLDSCRAKLKLKIIHTLSLTDTSSVYVRPRPRTPNTRRDIELRACGIFTLQKPTFSSHHPTCFVLTGRSGVRVSPPRVKTMTTKLHPDPASTVPPGVRACRAA